MRVLLDTQIFIALSKEGVGALGARARKLVEEEENDLMLSAVSVTEIAVKASIQKLEIGALNVLKAADYLRLTLIPYELRHAMRLFDLPLHHRDPFDRMLIATALSESVPIISADREFKHYKNLSVVW